MVLLKQKLNYTLNTKRTRTKISTYIHFLLNNTLLNLFVVVAVVFVVTLHFCCCNKELTHEKCKEQYYIRSA